MTLYFVLCRFLISLFLTIRSFISKLLLKNILGWNIEGLYDSYDYLRKGKHVIIYNHTSVYESIIIYLFSLTYDIPIISIAKKELTQVPFFGKIMIIFNNIYIERRNDKNTVAYITNELVKRDNFIIVIASKNTIKKTNDFKSDFFHIALNTESCIHVANINFEDQIVSIVQLFDKETIKISSYDSIKEQTKIIMDKQKPYYKKTNNENNRNNKYTSFINMERSLLLYIAPLIVLNIILKQIILLL